MSAPDEVLLKMAEAVANARHMLCDAATCNGMCEAPEVHFAPAVQAALDAARDAGFVLVPVAEYLIWSNQHGMWWRAARKGYTPELADAGRYSREEAIEISRGGDFWRAFERPREAPILVEDAAMLAAAPKVPS